MKRLSNLLVWAALALAGVLVVLNWSVLMAPAELDLVFARIQAPLGVVMLGLAGALVALFFVAYLQNQIGSLLETKRLLKEVGRAHELADKAEASRIENLHQLIATEFRLLNERLDAAAAAAATPAAKAARAESDPPPFVGILPPPI